MTASRRFALGTFALALSVHLALATISAGTEPSSRAGPIRATAASHVAPGVRPASLISASNSPGMLRL